MRLPYNQFAGYSRIDIVAGRPACFMEKMKRILRERAFDVPLRYVGTFDGSPGVTVYVSVYCVDETNQLFGLTVHDLETKEVLEETIQASRLGARLQELFQMPAKPVVEVRPGISVGPLATPVFTSSAVDVELEFPCVSSAASGEFSEPASP